jgi:hypothetical protein
MKATQRPAPNAVAADAQRGDDRRVKERHRRHRAAHRRRPLELGTAAASTVETGEDLGCELNGRRGALGLERKRRLAGEKLGTAGDLCR